MYDNIGFLFKVFSRITVKLNKRNASTLLKLQNVIKGAYNPMLECQELKVVFEISRWNEKPCLPPCLQVLFGFAKGDSGICEKDKNTPKSLKINKYTYVKLKGSLLNEYSPISSLPLLGVLAGCSL